MNGPEHLRRCVQCGESWIDHTRDHIPTCSGFQGESLASCTCGVDSLDPLHHWFDCPVRTVFDGLPA